MCSYRRPWHSQLMHLRTERLLLRDFEMTDLPAFSRLVGDDRTMATWGGVWDAERSETELREHLEHLERHGFAPVAVTLRGELIGDIGLQYLEGGPDVELLYRLRAEAWGRGYAYEACLAVLRHAFTTLALGEVVAVIADDNERSLRLSARLGFEPGAAGTYYGHALRLHRVASADFLTASTYW